MRLTNSLCLDCVSESFFDSKEITGSRSSTWVNIRFSMTLRIFS